VLGRVLVAERDEVLQGILTCSDPECLRECPILDGIPLLLNNLREFVQQNQLALTSRNDLSADLESLFGDCYGPQTAFDLQRQYLSHYAWDHYGEFDPAEDEPGDPPGGVARLFQRGLELVAALPNGSRWTEGNTLDAGCSVGRTTFELAQRSAGLVLGVDLNFSKLQLAQSIARTGRVRYPRRRLGLVYDRREFDVTFSSAERVDFWLADVGALPLPQSSVVAWTALNVLDCVANPIDVLQQLENVLQSGGWGLLATPYDWSPSATPVEAWLGGHSQRADHRGAAEPLLRMLLTPGAQAHSCARLRLGGEVERISWPVRLHARSRLSYDVHLLLAFVPEVK